MNTLNLEKYPKILPEVLNEKETKEQRLKTIESIRNQMNMLVAMLTGFLDDISSFEAKSDLLDKKAEVLKGEDYDLTLREAKLNEREEKMKSENLYIVNANQEFRKREEKLQGQRDYVLEIEKSKKEYEEKRAQAIKQEASVVKKLKELESARDDVRKDKDLIEKSFSIDAQRKFLLDVREERIKTQEKRLQIEQKE